MADKFEIACPCCEATIVIDAHTGEILFSNAPKQKKSTGSLESMVAGLESQKSEAEKRFERELELQKDRSRLLEEKFKEAMKRVDKSDTSKPFNPMDMD
jgi:hypothetical protein